MPHAVGAHGEDGHTEEHMHIHVAVKMHAHPHVAINHTSITSYHGGSAHTGSTATAGVLNDPSPSKSPWRHEMGFSPVWPYVILARAT